MNVKRHTYIKTIEVIPGPRRARGNRRDSALDSHKHTHTNRNYDPNTPTHRKTMKATANPQTHLDLNY
jgi:hypothetical protein